MNKTKIEWVKNPDGSQGYTWNPITGCFNGCEYCYARRLANGRLKSRYLANINVAPIELSTHPSKMAEYSNRKRLLQMLDPFYPRFWPEKLKEFDNLFAIDEPNYLKKIPKKPRGIFVCDMSDLFGIGVPEEWTRQVLELIEQVDMHRFYLLTKQPQNLIKWSPFPDNCWVGVSACTNDMYYSVMRVLANRHYWYNPPHNSVKAKVRYISFEPLLERVQFSGEYGVPLEKSGINWVIIGSQTKPYKPPKIEWVQEIVEACDKAGIPVFL